MKTITSTEVETLRQAGHAVHVFPRKKMVRIDGCKLYQLTATLTRPITHDATYEYIKRFGND